MKQSWFKYGAGFVLLTILFAIAYTQSPLFTSNQNQYFLHGLADAGQGYLADDWLANTNDPTPVFSSLVYLTEKYLSASWVNYLYYAILMGVYLFSLIGIASKAFSVRKDRKTTIVFISLLFLVNSAAIRFGFSRILGENWTYLLEDGVADQRLLGPVFQPSTFGVLLLLSIYLFLSSKPYLAVVSATIAASVHPTYLISAAVLTLAYMILTYRDEKNLLKAILIGFLAALTVTPILIYVYSNFVSTPAETTRQAQEILVNFRIPHHARLDWWFDWTAVFKMILVVVSLFLIRHTKRLFFIALLLTLVAISLTLLQFVLDSNQLALIFPWRISTILVPMSTTLILGFLVTNGAEKFSDQWQRYQKFLLAGSLMVLSLTILIGIVRMVIEFDRKSKSIERPMMTYVADNGEEGQNYLIHPKMQDFRLVTGLPILVDFKSIPYRDTDVLDWYRRNELANQFYKERDCDSLAQASSEFDVTHLIQAQDGSQITCPQLEVVYRDDNYGVYKIINK